MCRKCAWRWWTFAGQLCRQHQRLAKAADAVRGRVASQIGEPGAPAPRRYPGVGATAASRARRAAAPGIDIPAGRAARRGSAAWTGCACAIRRVAQRDDQDIEPALLESEDLLGDKSLG